MCQITLVGNWMDINIETIIKSSKTRQTLLQDFDGVVELMYQQECIPVGCLPPAQWLSGGCLVPGGLLRGVWSRGVSGPRGVVCSVGCLLLGGGWVWSLGGCCLLPGGCVCSWGVCAPGGVLWGGGCLLPGGCAPGRGGCLLCLLRGGVPCDLSHHAFDVTCMLPPHQLRLNTSAAAYILLAHCMLGYPPPLWTEWMTDTCKNITFANYICGR